MLKISFSESKINCTKLSRFSLGNPSASTDSAIRADFSNTIRYDSSNRKSFLFVFPISNIAMTGRTFIIPWLLIQDLFPLSGYFESAEYDIQIWVEELRPISTWIQPAGDEHLYGMPVVKFPAPVRRHYFSAHSTVLSGR